MKKEITFKSHDNQTKIHAYTWIPNIPIKGIIQIVHGMVENMNKYEEFAIQMNNQGYLVCGHDQLGHGKSVLDKKHYGYFAKDKPEQVVIDDIYELTKKMKDEYPNLPYIILGFSMGSFFTRNYLTQHGNELFACILIGSGKYDLYKLKTVEIINKFEEFLCGGEFYVSDLMKKKTICEYHKYFGDIKNSNNWLTKDMVLFDKVYQDETTHFEFTCNGYKTLFKSIKMNQKRKYLKFIPKDLPIFLLSGKDDPSTHFAKDTLDLQKRYNNLGIKNVKVKIYNNMRHDLLIEVERQIVINDIMKYVNEIKN